MGVYDKFKEYMLDKLGAKVDESNLLPLHEDKVNTEWQPGIAADAFRVLSRHADGSPKDMVQINTRMNAASNIMRRVNEARNPSPPEIDTSDPWAILDDPLIEAIYGNRHEGRGVVITDSSDPRYRLAQQNAAYVANLNNPDFDPTGEKAKAKAIAERGKKWGLD